VTTTLAQLIAKVRQDLRDTPAVQEFSDAELERWAARAVTEVSAVAGREQASALVTAASRDLSLATLTGLLDVVGIEYPTLRWPPEYVRFNVWGTVATLHIDWTPAAGEAVNVTWLGLHTLDVGGTTLLPEQEEAVILGAAGYALDAFAASGAHKLLTGGAPSEDALGREASKRLTAYGLALRRLRSRLRRRVMYTPEEPGPSQTTDFGP